MLLRHAEAYEKDTDELERILLELRLLRDESGSFEQISLIEDRPLLVINAESDPLCAAIPTQPNVTTVTAGKEKGRGHYYHVESPEEVADYTVSLLKELGLLGERFPTCATLTNR
jgi:hypothetical protein